LKRRDRDQIIEDARYGRLTPAGAEREAEQLGIAPLAGCPSPKTFDVMREAGWTLPMTVAWVMWRNPESVLSYFDPYRTACHDWHFRKWRIGFDGPIFEGHFLEPRSPATLSRLSLEDHFSAVEDSDERPILSFAKATQTLWKALQENVLHATGIPDHSAQRVKIPDHEWHDLQSVEESGRDVLRTGLLSSSGYSNIVFSRVLVVSVWPARQSFDAEAQLPPPIAPEGAGHFPIYSAAHWIATCGGKQSIDPKDSRIWSGAFSDLLARIASNEIEATGIRNGIREKIDGHIFASLRVDYPFSDVPLDLILSDELHLCSAIYIDEDDWQRGDGDCLRNRSGVRWSKLMVLKSDIARFWPSTIADARQERPILATGAPGRPTSMQLVHPEHQRRLDAGEAEHALRAEATALAVWLKKTHPSAPSLTVKTIENNIRERHREAMKPRN
jgi:hypothetical protein